MPDQHLGTILIVEDEPELRFILGAHLRTAGFDVIEACDGASAVRMAGESLPDVVIMDLGLPILDGIGATRALRADERTKHIPVIMLTARSGTDDIVRGLEAGAQEYLPKPFDVSELLARVRSVHRVAVASKNLDRLNSKLEVEVGIKSERLQRLYEFMRDLNHADSRDLILDLLIKCVEQATGAHRISLFVADGTGKHLICERAIGLDKTKLARIAIKDLEGATSEALKSGMLPATENDGHNQAPDTASERDVFFDTPLVSTSLKTADRMIGVLNVMGKEDGTPFSEEEIECIRSVADAAAIALDNMTRRSRMQQSVRVLLKTLGHLAEYRDEETTRHLDRVTKLALILGRQLRQGGPYAAQVSDDFVRMLVQAAPMHDIGKVGIPDEILTKPGALTGEEFQIMKTHTEIGRRVLSRAVDPACPVPLLEMCIDIAHCHHERWDGRGYPKRREGLDIPLAARIIAVVDAYDAITSQRCYKAAKTHEQAVEIIQCDSGTHFDPVLVDAFLACHDQFNRVRERFADPPVVTAS